VTNDRNPTDMGRREMFLRGTALAATAGLAAGVPMRTAQAQAQTNAPASSTRRPNIVMLMTDDTGWNDFGCYSGGGAALGHPTPNVDRLAKEGAVCRVVAIDETTGPTKTRACDCRLNCEIAV